MKHFILCLAFSLYAFCIYGQGYGEDSGSIEKKIENDFGKFENDILKLNTGQVYKVGDTIHLGYGSGPYKEFEFIYLSPINWVNTMSGMVNDKQRLGSTYANQTMIIKNIKNIGRKKTGYKWLLILGGGNIANYWCEINEALQTKEVTSSLIDSKIENINPVSKADEIKKLKELLDSGAITQDEFNDAKKKILNGY